jgi:hypothetical protein
MAEELKVYNQFNELILHLRLAPRRPFPLQVVQGTRELREAIRALYGQDFDQTVIVAGQHQRFIASWGSPEYLGALAGYWKNNFQWRTEIRSEEVLIGAGSSPSNLAAQSLGFGAGGFDEPAPAGGLTGRYRSWLVAQPHLQTEPMSYSPRLETNIFDLGASITNYREPARFRPHQVRASALGITERVEGSRAESDLGLTVGAARQGGSPYGATISAPG